MFSITVIFDDTFEPPRIAKTGFSLELKTLSILSISLARSSPKHFLP